MKRTHTHVTQVLLFSLAGLLCPFVYALPVLPNASGFGIETPAGRGSSGDPSTIYVVTNLNDGGSGSLRAAMEAAVSPRVVVFEVSGIIELESDIKIRAGRGFLTVAGQTAPSPGIILKGAGISIQANDVLIQHIAVRPGNEAGTPGLGARDCIKIEPPVSPASDVYNVVLDHVSMSWSTDEAFSVWSNGAGEAYDITVMNCIFAEALKDAGHPDGDHAMGPFVGRSVYRVSMIRNLMAHNESRNPMSRDDCSDLQFINNYVYRPGIWGGQAWHLGIRGSGDVDFTATVRGNVVELQTSDTSAASFAVHSDAPTNVSIYENDNSVYKTNGTPTWYTTDGSGWNTNVWDLNKTITQLMTEPSLFTSLGVPVLDSEDVLDYVLANAGARSADRDPVDERIIDQIVSSTGGFVDEPGDVGGYPSWGTVTHTLTNLPTTNRDDVMPSGYTRLEEYLHGWANQVEGGVPTGPEDDPGTFADNFEESEAAGFTPGGSTDWEVVASGGGNVYRQSDDSADARAIVPQSNWSDQSIQADITPTDFNGSNRWVGLFGRYIDISNHYYLLLRDTSEVLQLRKKVDGTLTTLDDYSMAVNEDETYTLRLEIDGNALRGYVNGVERVSATDSDLPVGKVAVGMFKATADVNNVIASSNPAATISIADDFQDGNANGWTPVGTTSWAVIHNGSSYVYEQDNMSGGAASYIDSTSSNTDQTIEMYLQITDTLDSTDRWAGPVARYTNDSNYYYMTVRENGTTELKKIQGGSASVLDSTTFSFSHSSVYDVKLEVIGTTINGYLDGELILEAQDPGTSITEGRAGLRMYKAAVEVDEVLVTVP